MTIRAAVIVRRARIRVTDSCSVRDKIARSDLRPNGGTTPLRLQIKRRRAGAMG
ncbi:MAG TPA: hypothetical protein VIP49_06120 [Candidatus Udaeobacter sp.]